VVDAGEGADEGFLDGGQVMEGEVAFGELAVEEAFHDHVVDGGFDAAGGGVLRWSDDGLAGVADHDDGGFADWGGVRGNGIRFRRRRRSLRLLRRVLRAAW